MPARPIVNMFKRGVVLDISTSFGLGITFGYLYWYGYHLPAVRRRDQFYAKIEQEKWKNTGRY
ncbi:hypothetical protein MMC22_010389 [Lobaria immixta]|nr:hypothetical protein [Lobaria immixta]